jgi:hypothetical protein
MTVGCENGRKRRAALTSVKASGDFEAVSQLGVTEGAANPGHLFRLAPRKPCGFLRIKPKNLITGLSRVKTRPVFEYTS